MSIKSDKDSWDCLLCGCKNNETNTCFECSSTEEDSIKLRNNPKASKPSENASFNLALAHTIAKTEANKRKGLWECNKCHTLNKIATNACKKCDNTYTKFLANSVLKTELDNKGLICEACTFVNTANSKRCEACSTPFGKDDPIFMCSKCDKKVSPYNDCALCKLQFTGITKEKPIEGPRNSLGLNPMTPAAHTFANNQGMFEKSDEQKRKEYAKNLSKILTAKDTKSKDTKSVNTDGTTGLFGNDRAAREAAGLPVDNGASAAASSNLTKVIGLNDPMPSTPKQNLDLVCDACSFINVEKAKNCAMCATITNYGIINKKNPNGYLSQNEILKRTYVTPKRSLMLSDKKTQKQIADKSITVHRYGKINEDGSVAYEEEYDVTPKRSITTPNGAASATGDNTIYKQQNTAKSNSVSKYGIVNADGSITYEGEYDVTQHAKGALCDDCMKERVYEQTIYCFDCYLKRI